jgi:hypothetical protein
MARRYLVITPGHAARSKQWTTASPSSTQVRLDQPPRLPQAVIERALKTKAVDRVEFDPRNVSALLNLLKKCRAVPGEKGSGAVYRTRFSVRNSAQVEKIPRLRTVTSMPQLLRDDFGAGLNLDVPPGVENVVEGLIGER